MGSEMCIRDSLRTLHAYHHVHAKQSLHPFYIFQLVSVPVIPARGVPRHFRASSRNRLPPVASDRAVLRPLAQRNSLLYPLTFLFVFIYLTKPTLSDHLPRCVFRLALYRKFCRSGVSGPTGEGSRRCHRAEDVDFRGGLIAQLERRIPQLVLVLFVFPGKFRFFRVGFRANKKKKTKKTKKKKKSERAERALSSFEFGKTRFVFTMTTMQTTQQQQQQQHQQ